MQVCLSRKKGGKRKKKDESCYTSCNNTEKFLQGQWLVSNILHKRKVNVLSHKCAKNKLPQNLHLGLRKSKTCFVCGKNITDRIFIDKCVLINYKTYLLMFLNQSQQVYSVNLIYTFRRKIVQNRILFSTRCLLNLLKNFISYLSF